MTAPVVAVPETEPGKGPGRATVGPIGVVTTAVLLTLVGILFLSLLIWIWPHKGTGADVDPVSVSIAGFPAFPMWGEQRLLIIVMLAGALGGLLHGLRSLGWYIGNRNLVWSWLAYYALLPLIGSVLAVAFYIVLRGGLISPSAPVSDTSAFGMAAIAVLVGMFSTPASLKLQQVAETFFTKAQPGADKTPQHAVGQTPVAPASPSTNGNTPDSSERGDDTTVNGTLPGVTVPQG